jgi:hypothetical protein
VEDSSVLQQMWQFYAVHQKDVIVTVHSAQAVHHVRVVAQDATIHALATKIA